MKIAKNSTRTVRKGKVKRNKGPRVFMLLNFCGNQLRGTLAEF